MTALRPCVDLIVFRDDIFEGPEQMTITIQGFVTDGTTVTPSLSGVTINPVRTTVTIRDNDSESKEALNWLMYQTAQIPFVH